MVVPCERLFMLHAGTAGITMGDLPAAIDVRTRKRHQRVPDTASK